MNVKKWTLLVAMIGALLVTAFANDKDEIEKKREDEFRKRRAYFTENIKPKVDALRNKLETSITAEDKNEIERLREEIINQRLIENQFFFEARALRIKGEEVSEDLILELKAQRIVIENLYDEAKLIANNYRPEIDDLVAELKDDREEWSGKRDGMRGEHRGRGEFKGKRGPHGPEGFSPSGIGFGHGDFDHGSRRDLGLVTFLLWDVDRG